MSIVRTKLIPPRLVSGVVDRPRLSERLDRIWSSPFGLIVAPAGFGKSTLARKWITARSAQTGWLTLDQADNDVDRFIRYLLEAIASVAPEFVVNTRSLVERSSRPGVQELAETLADELMDLDDDICIVLDEAEHLSAPEAWEFIECLIRLAPPRFHLLVLSRIDPPLPLARLRMREQIVELRGNDLLLDSTEIRSLFTQQGVALNDGHVEDLQRVTYGWPAGVRLALVHGVDPGEQWRFHSAPAMSSAEFVLDPLAAELVERLPPAIGETLLAASIVDDLNVDLLEALVGRHASARQLIDEYTRAGVIIGSAPRGGGWVRFHPLFRDLFRRQLTSRRTRAEINALHHAAANWFISEGDIRNAVTHLLAARAIEDVIQLLNTEIPNAIDHEDWAAVSGWLDEIPEEIIARSPVLALGYCWVLFFKGNWLAMRAERKRLRAFLEGMPPDTPGRTAWLAELVILDATEVGSFLAQSSDLLARIEQAAGDVDPRRRFVRGHVVLQSAMVLEELGRSSEADATIAEAIGEGSGRVDSEVIRALVARCFVLRQRGDFAGLEAATSELELITRTHHLPISRGWALVFRGFVFLQRNDLAGAEADFTELAADHGRVHIACVREGMLMLARVYHALGDSTESAAVIRRLREILAHQGSVEMLPPVASLERFLAYLHDPRQVTAGQGVADLPAIMGATPHLLHHPVTTAVLIHCELGAAGAEHALLIAETFAGQARAIHYPYWEPEILALQAIALSALGRDAEARARMQQALSNPIASYLKRTFLDLGYRSHALYRELVDDPGAGAMVRWLLGALEQPRTEPELVPAAETPAPRESVTYRRTLLSLLTDRELTVLELLEKRLSYKEIGDALSISPLTVKRHAGNIYDKLGATSRREAVEIAVELGWKPVRNP